MNVPCKACQGTGLVDYGGETRQCDLCRGERDVTESLLRHRECIEKAKLLAEKYAYPDSIGWADMESDDVSKLWRILEDALLDGETSPF